MNWPICGTELNLNRCLSNSGTNLRTVFLCQGCLDQEKWKMYAVSLAMRYENFWLLTLCCRHYGFKQYDKSASFYFSFYHCSENNLAPSFWWMPHSSWLLLQGKRQIAQLLRYGLRTSYVFCSKDCCPSTARRGHSRFLALALQQTPYSMCFWGGHVILLPFGS